MGFLIMENLFDKLTNSDHSDGNYESEYNDPRLDLSVTMIGTSLYSGSLTEADLLKMVSREKMWQDFKEKISNFDFWNAFQEFTTLKEEYSLNKVDFWKL